MAGVEEHYKDFLSPHYAWIRGGFDANFRDNRAFFQAHDIRPSGSGVAVDLGAGCGFQTIPLAELGFRVTAIDLSRALLSQLEKHAAGLPVVTIQDNLLNFSRHCPEKVEIIVCMGDTLTHLDSRAQVRTLIETAHAALEPEGLLILAFRDLTVELMELDRFVPVRSDSEKIFTCFLEFEKEFVKVHDLFYEKTGGRWDLKKSFFRKLRIPPQWVKQRLQKTGFKLKYHRTENRMTAFIARRC